MMDSAVSFSLRGGKCACCSVLHVFLRHYSVLNAEHNIVRRKYDKVAEDDDIEAGSPSKRDRPSHSSKHCHLCSCRLELAVREVGKCKCGTFSSLR